MADSQSPFCVLYGVHSSGILKPWETGVQSLTEKTGDPEGTQLIQGTKSVSVRPDLDLLPYKYSGMPFQT